MPARAENPRVSPARKPAPIETVAVRSVSVAGLTVRSGSIATGGAPELYAAGLDEEAMFNGGGVAPAQ